VGFGGEVLGANEGGKFGDVDVDGGFKGGVFFAGVLGESQWIVGGGSRAQEGLRYPWGHLLSPCEMLVFVEQAEDVVFSGPQSRRAVEPFGAHVGRADGAHVGEEFGGICDQLVGADAGDGAVVVDYPFVPQVEVEGEERFALEVVGEAHAERPPESPESAVGVDLGKQIDAHHRPRYRPPVVDYLRDDTHGFPHGILTTRADSRSKMRNSTHHCWWEFSGFLPGLIDVHQTLLRWRP